MLAFVAILLTATAAFLGAPWWSAVIGAAVLAAVSLSEHKLARIRLAAVPLGSVVAREATVLSIAHASGAAVAAYALGTITHWVLV